MKYVYIENRKYQILPYSQMFNFRNRLCVKKLDSDCIFFVNCDKSKFLEFVTKNNLECFTDNDKNEDLYIRKFRFYEYILYFKDGFLVMETPIKYRFLTEVGHRYFGVETYILDAIKDISGKQDILGYCTQMDEGIPFRKNYKETKKCNKSGCNVKIDIKDKHGYCKKHLILKSFKYWLNERYQNELEWQEDIPIKIN